MKKSVLREMYNPIIDKEREFDYILEPKVKKEKIKTMTKVKSKSMKVK